MPRPSAPFRLVQRVEVVGEHRFVNRPPVHGNVFDLAVAVVVGDRAIAEQDVVVGLVAVLAELAREDVADERSVGPPDDRSLSAKCSFIRTTPIK